MSYEPTVWKDGDLVTSAKLNKLEQGVAAGGGVLIIHDEDGTLDKTWQEIHDANACFIIKTTDDYKYREYVFKTAIEGVDNEKKYVIYISSTNNLYIANSPESYPILQEGGTK